MMHFRFQKAAYVAAFFVTFAFCASLSAQQHSLRTKHIPELVRNGQASAVGQVEDARQLHLVISLPLRNQDVLNTLLQQIYDPQSPNFHHYLKPQQFTDSFAPTQQDYDTVVAWAKAKGLQVTATTANRRLIEVDAPAGKINRAFNVQLKTYQDTRHARTFHAPDREPTVDLAVPLLAVSGLDDAIPPHTHLKKKDDEVAQTSNTISENVSAPENNAITASGPSNTYLPSDMRAAYYGSGPLDGTGQTVAIFSFDDYPTSDLAVYYSHTGMSTNVPVTNIYVNGYNSGCFGFNSNGSLNYSICNDAEQILDIVNVIGMAPGLSGVQFYVSNSAVSALNQIADDDTASVISSSWGGGDFGPACEPVFLQFQAQGQTFLNATGDSGAFNSSTYDPPSLDPNILQVGGTDLITMGAGGPWSSETGWADSGGGFMSGIAIPTWQQTSGVITATNKGSATLRNSPDVAAEANFDNTTVLSGKFASGYGGTSYATPRWAGFIALANQQSVANGNGRLGFVNPTLYKIGLGATYATNFHDIISGSTALPAVAGYDLVTGWGSPTAALIAKLAGTTAGDYSLAASPNPLTIAQGSSGTTTVTVSGIAGFTGSVALSASLPTGVTASFSPASTTDTSTMTLTVSSTAPTGLKTVTITGIAGILTHTASLPVTITSGADYALSASPTAVTAVQGAAASSTITVTPGTGFSGPVALSASGLPAGVTASFSPASATTTSTLTLTASSTATLGQATITVTGTSGSLSHTSTVTLTAAAAADYSLAVLPSNVSVVQGAAGTSTITVTPVNGFIGAVALSAAGLPAGVTAAFSPASATSTSTLTLTASSTATLGLATVTITGTSDGLTHTAAVAVTITPAPDYSLSASPASVIQGASGTSTITVTDLNGFSGAVALSATGLPAGVTASFSPASATSTSTLTLTASSTATVGPAMITITGTSGSLTHTTTVTLTVTPAPDYSLTASPVSVIQGNSGTSTIAVTDLNGFAGAVNLSASGLPAGVTASFSPSSTTGTSILTLTASSTATSGPATVTITGTSGSLVHTATVALTVVAPDYSLGASGGVTITRGTVGTTSIAVRDLNGFSGAVNLAVSGLPGGVTASFSPTTTASSSTLTVAGLSYAAIGSVTLTITGTSGNLTHTTTVALTVSPPPDFSLTVSPNTFNLSQGGSSSATITVTGINGFNTPVIFSAPTLPAGVTASFSPVGSTGTSTITLTAASNAAVGGMTIPINATSATSAGNVFEAFYALVIVNATPDYSLSASPSNVNIVQGTSGTSTVIVTDLNSFAGSVALTASGLPAGVTASFSPASITSASRLTLTASSTATVGPATITIIGVSGSLIHTATVGVTVSSSGDYLLSASPVSVVQGSNGASTVAVTDIGGFTGSVNLAATGLPAGVTATFSPASTTGTSTLTLTASGTASLGLANVTITGTSGTLMHATTLALTLTPAPDYSLSASSVSVVQGASGTSTIAVTPINNFAGSVALSASGLPAGVTASFSPASATTTSTLTLTASSTATLGGAIITVTGTSGSLTHTTTVTLTVTPAPDYSLSASPTSVVQGATGTSTVTITGINNFAASVALSASGLPAGVTASFSPARATNTSTLTLTASRIAMLGQATVTITGTSGSLTHTTTVALTITPAPDYSLSASPNAISVVQGTVGTSTITITGINSFAGSVALSVTGLPAGVTASFSPASTTGTSILTLTASGTATVGPATITITGTSGSLTHTTTVALTVLMPNYSLATSGGITVTRGTVGTASIAVTDFNGFTGVVKLVVSGLPGGTTASLSPATTTSGSTLTVTGSSWAVLGPVTLTITGTSGNLTHTTTVALTVAPPPDFSLTISPDILNLLQGGTVSATLTVKGINGFNTPVNLSVPSLPAGVTASFTPVSTTGTATMTLTAAGNAAVGGMDIAINATSATSAGNVNHIVYALVIVNAKQ